MAKKQYFISLDLGSENIIAYIGGHGVIYNERSIMAYNAKNKKLLALGNEAYELLGKTHKNIELIRPINDGVISNLKTMHDMIKEIFKKRRLMKVWKGATVLLASPSGVTKLESDALKKIGLKLGAKNVIIEEEVKMAALGAGINIDSPQGFLVVDCGGGTTDISIISSGDVVVSNSIKIAGRHMTNEIQKYLRANYSIIVGEKTAQEVKHILGSLDKNEHEKKLKVYGRDMIDGMPKECEIGTSEVRQILEVPIKIIYNACQEVLRQSPSELSGDIQKNGVILCGGGSLVRGFAKNFREYFEIPAKTAPDPLNCVIEGTKKLEPYINDIIAENSAKKY